MHIGFVNTVIEDTVEGKNRKGIQLDDKGCSKFWKLTTVDKTVFPAKERCKNDYLLVIN